jgi:hypothetical protein
MVKLPTHMTGVRCQSLRLTSGPATSLGGPWATCSHPFVGSNQVLFGLGSSKVHWTFQLIKYFTLTGSHSMYEYILGLERLQCTHHSRKRNGKFEGDLGGLKSGIERNHASHSCARVGYVVSCFRGKRPVPSGVSWPVLTRAYVVAGYVGFVGSNLHHHWMQDRPDNQAYSLRPILNDMCLTQDLMVIEPGRPVGVWCFLLWPLCRNINITCISWEA